MRTSGVWRQDRPAGTATGIALVAAYVLAVGATGGCTPDEGSQLDAGDDAVADSRPSGEVADADDARSFPEPEVCEAVCDRVYETCGHEFPDDDRMPYNRQACYNDCLYGWFDGAENCLRETDCDRRSVVSCVRDDAVDETIDNPCDDETEWPDAWVDYEQRLVELTNERRTEGAVCDGDEMAPVPPLETDPRLRCAARRHSRDMADRDFFAHENPDGDEPSDRAAAADYPETVGENISAGRETPEATVGGWMNSPGHCRNIMRPEYEHIGVGYVHDRGLDWHHLTTQVFGVGK